ncbi:UHRF1-binding protein 1 [Platysternon megacephalum]|uniref:UHRF1-binding protein 1 n=1 Tax=Platysternon megacephalum TaxID=55544 RepID=A0A4D9EAE2_9SAUR|nr:UHRF1-binding protein 1 [Platysternon megacephalum]
MGEISILYTIEPKNLWLNQSVFSRRAPSLCLRCHVRMTSSLPRVQEFSLNRRYPPRFSPVLILVCPPPPHGRRVPLEPPPSSFNLSVFVNLCANTFELQS